MNSGRQSNQVPGSLTLADHEGRWRSLAEWAAGRPLVVQMVRYYG